MPTTILVFLLLTQVNDPVAQRIADRLLNFQTPTPLTVEVYQHPVQALEKAYIDLSNQEDPTFYRYIWIPDKSPDVAAEVNFTINECVSRSDILVRPVILYDGLLLRYDLRHLATSKSDLLDLVFLWADIAFDDQYFSQQLLTTKIIDVAPFRFLEIEYKAKTLRLSEPQPYTEPYGSQLATLTGYQGAVFRADWFIEIANTTLKPGRYYDFTGIAGDNLERFLARFDIKVAELDLGTKDERAALFRSVPTGKPRLIKILTSNVARPSKSRGIVAVTYDITDEQFEAINDPIENLLNFDFAAYEIIADRPNGTHVYAIFDKAGVLLKEGDPKIAPDHRELEVLGTKVLQSGLSCRRCHGYGHGWQHFDNDIMKLLKNDFTIFDDLASVKTRDETLVLLSRLYGSEPSQKPLGVLEIGRLLYAQTTDKITLGRSLPFMAETLHTIHSNYKSMLDTDNVLRELGIKCDKPTVLFQRIFTPILGIQEHPVIGAIKAGIPIQRRQFERVYGYMMVRTLNSGVNNAANN